MKNLNKKLISLAASVVLAASMQADCTYELFSISSAKGTTIGEYALIGSGAVVNKDVKPYALMVGVPAKQIGWVGISGNTLNFKENIAEDEFAIYHIISCYLEVSKK